MQRGKRSDSPPAVSIVPAWLQIIAGRQPNEVEKSRAVRAAGTDDWLLVATTDGEGLVRAANGVEQRLTRGRLLLFRPGTPQDYGWLSPEDPWHNTWVHFRPRPHWLDLLDWPEIDSGVLLLDVGGDFAGVESELDRLIEVIHGPGRIRYEAAMNALERILILMDDVNPRRRGPEIDPRITRALVLIGERVSSPTDVAGLCEEVGLSRSQFTALFTRAMKVSPQVYIESIKLNRAARMLETANWSVSQVAGANGFSSVFYFSARFRKHFGVSPTEYRERLSRTRDAAEPARVPQPTDRPGDARSAAERDDPYTARS